MSFLTDIKQKLEKGIESTSQKSRKMLDMSRLTLTLRGRKETEEQLYIRLGREIYSLWEKEKKVELTEQTQETLERIDHLRQVIAELEDRLMELRRQQNAVESSDPVQESAEPAGTVEQGPFQTGQSPNDGEYAYQIGSSDARFQSGNRLTGEGANVYREEEQMEAADDWIDMEAIFICPHCGNRVKEDTEVCPHCHKHVYD
ncbi:zinc ribbon domain-containing protein [Paludifilum halophilum]|uniref:C2H2-type domain-containing protein n=1 Tax=Paludifilum halophilum TaxID=1642702 RepID=A0A235BAK7_9BACL|nr:zinc ribbon domain-containing protein [Paludifilum halophilum]OYD08907.1 hypothetical protein CHM34_03755 [Paludifilum halophilum]